MWLLSSSTASRTSTTSSAVSCQSDRFPEHQRIQETAAVAVLECGEYSTDTLRSLPKREVNVEIIPSASEVCCTAHPARVHALPYPHMS